MYITAKVGDEDERNRWKPRGSLTPGGIPLYVIFKSIRFELQFTADYLNTAIVYLRPATL